MISNERDAIAVLERMTSVLADIVLYLETCRNEPEDEANAVIAEARAVIASCRRGVAA